MSSHVVWLRVGTVVAMPYARRAAVTATVLLFGIMVLSAATLSMGSLGIHPDRFIDILQGTADAKTRFTLERLRGPRLLTAAGVGAALGVSGGLFQTVTRNPLGSPDVIGLGAGAGAGVAVATLLWPGAIPVPVGAVAGAGIAIGLVYVATGMGFASPGRVILTGIGVAAMAWAATQFVVAVALRDQAGQLAAYLVGSLGSRNMGHAVTIGAALLLLLPFVVLLGHRLLMMDMGDLLADTLGAGAARTRTMAIVLSVLLSAAAVSVAGPIAFVALTAPHIARRLTGSAGPNLVMSALTGALVMIASDLMVQQVPVLDGLPVGIVTAGVGGCYLGYLLLQEWRKTAS